MKNITLNIDKSKWQSTRLGDVASEISKRVDNPGESKYDRFVGLENFVSGDVKIKTFNSTENLTSSAKAFQAGDILFARRNPYLRRASLVDFDGCCSGDAFVLRENHDKVIPGLLAFLMNTNTLWDFAISNAAGTMSKRVKWRDLSEYEFLLPPKEQQSKIAELLWSMDDVIHKNNRVLDHLKISYQAQVEKFVPRNAANYWILQDLIKTRRGLTYKSSDYSDEVNGLPMLNLKSIERGGGFNKNGMKYFKGTYKEDHFAKNSDLILACTDLTRHGRVVGYPLHPSIYQDKRMLFTMDLVAIEVNETELERDYLYYVLKSGWVHWILFAHSPGTTVLHLDLNGMKNIKVPKYDKSTQKIMVQKLKQFENSIFSVESKITNSKNLLKSLINEFSNGI